jgi:hypothetical protein
MNATPPKTYAVRVRGHLDDHWSEWFGGVAITRDDDGRSTLIANVVDQAQLHGLLSGLRDIGVELLELRTVDLEQSGPPCPSPQAPDASPRDRPPRGQRAP